MENQNKKILDSLPSNIRKAIELFDWKGVTGDIAKKHKLHIDDRETLKKISMSVATGEISSKLYAQILQKKLLFTDDQINSLIEDVNTYIFSELQNLAFSKETTHADLHNELADEGILLVDDEVRVLKNTSEDVTNNVPNTSYVPKYKRKIVETNTHALKSDVGTQYNEHIELSDLAGITKHRTPYTHHETVKAANSHLSKDLYEQSYISKGHSFDASPKKAEQITEDGGYLDHISQQ